MGMTQEEVVLKLGLDTRDFDRRLADHARIAKQYEGKAGSAYYTGSAEGGSMPQSWQLGQLSRMSQEAIKARSGVAGVFDAFKSGLREVSPGLASLVDGLTSLAAKFGPWGAAIAAGITVATIAFKTAVGTLKEAFSTAKEAGDLGMSSSSLMRFKQSAYMAGEDRDATCSRLFKFQQFLGRIAEGDKIAAETFKELTGQSAIGKTLNQNLELVADGFDRVSDTARKARVSVEMFGKGAAGSIPDTLAGLKTNQLESASDEDVAVLSQAWRYVRSGWAISKAKVKATVQTAMAGGLKQLGVEGKTDPPLPLAATPEGIVAASGAAKKATEERQKAEMDFLDALLKRANLTTRIAAYSEHLVELNRSAQDMERAGLVKTKEYSELRKKIVDMEDSLVEAKKKQADIAEKELALQKAIRDERSKLSAAQKAAADARMDRSGWTVSDLAGAGETSPMSKEWENGIPQKLYDAAANWYGRDLTPQEYGEMRKSFEQQRTLAWGVTDAEDAAKAFRAMGREDLAGNATNAALMMRQQIQALTGSEADPMKSMQENLHTIRNDIAALLSKASREGIHIQPVNGA